MPLKLIMKLIMSVQHIVPPRASTHGWRYNFINVTTSGLPLNLIISLRLRTLIPVES